ncbi:MAG: glycosyltransferase family 2 protein [Desulfobia sp.]
MKESLILLRAIGGSLGFILIILSFIRFRSRLIRRRGFLISSLLGAGLLIVSIIPDTVNIIAGMLQMDNRQYGRLITLLILSSFLLWIIVLSLINRNTTRSIQFDFLVRKLAVDNFLARNDLTAIKYITIIIPALNEAENLRHILPEMPAAISGQECCVLVVDDGSDDDTVEAVRENKGLVVSNPINRGGGAALRLGYDIATAGGAGIVVTMDGDGQHIPGEIENLVKPIIEDRLDIVIGSRILGKREKDSMIRWLGIHIFNHVINLLAGTRITDCSNGFRAFRVASLQKVLLRQDQFHTAELIIDAAKKKIRIGEAPVTVLRRHTGASKKGRNMSYGLNFSKTVFKTWLRK